MPSYNRKLNNDELASIYDYLMGNINQVQLAKEVKRIRTNTYYYIGRACAYWLKIGILRFRKIEKQEDLGGENSDE